jgi:magnesium-transporting ATPase (P-type)
MKQPASLSKLELQIWLKNFGQLEIIVPDKTGTLTCNHMKLQIWLKNFDRLAENGRA